MEIFISRADMKSKAYKNENKISSIFYRNKSGKVSILS